MYPRHYTGHTNAAADYGDTELEPAYLEPTRPESKYQTIDSHNASGSQQESVAEYATPTPDSLDIVEGDNGDGTTSAGAPTEYGTMDESLRERICTRLA